MVIVLLNPSARVQIVLVYQRETAKDFQEDREDFYSKLREIDPKISIEEHPLGKSAFFVAFLKICKKFVVLSFSVVYRNCQ